MNKINDQEKPHKIINLKGRNHKRQAFQKKQNAYSHLHQISNVTPTVISSKPCQMGRPILIRYIDPVLAPIFKQLNLIKSRCELISSENYPIGEQRQQQINDLLKSTKNITLQMEEIIKNGQITQDGAQKQTVSILQQTAQDFTQPQQKEQVDQEDIIDQVQEKIQSLSIINQNLKQQLCISQDKQKQIEEINQNLEETVKQKDEILQSLLRELKEQLSKSQQCQLKTKLSEILLKYSSQ